VCVWGYLTRLELVVVQCACEPSDSRALEADQQLAIHGTRHLQVRAVLLRSYPISLSLALPWQAHAHVLMIVESSISCGWSLTMPWFYGTIVPRVSTRTASYRKPSRRWLSCARCPMSSAPRHALS